jgi:hypothetical protein
VLCKGTGTSRAVQTDTPDTHGSFDVLDSAFFYKLETGVDLPVHMVSHFFGEQDAAWFTEVFKTGGDVDAITVEVVILDNNVASIYPHAQQNLLGFAASFVAFTHAPLNVDGALSGFDDAWELNERTITSHTHDLPAAGGDLGIDERFSIRLQTLDGARLITFDEPAVTDNVSYQYGGEAALHIATLA